MNENESMQSKNTKQRDDENAALIAAQLFIIFSGIYWFLQLESVRALLELAYG